MASARSSRSLVPWATRQRGVILGLLLVTLSGCTLVTRPTPPIPPAGSSTPPPAAGGATAGAPAPAPSGTVRPILPEDVAGFFPGWTEEGIASWYGPTFHGRATASGEIYDQMALTAAHQTLPFGTLVEILNLDSGRQVQLRINDRGPFVAGRVLDVSRRGAEELAMVGPGTARVRIEILEVPEPTRCWEVQVGSYQDRANAETRASALAGAGVPNRIEPGPDGLLRVRAGPFPERGDALSVRQRWGGILLAC
jgi:rare lipoprotein A